MESNLFEIMMYVTLGAIALWVIGMIVYAVVMFSRWLLQFLPLSHWH